MRKQPNKFRPVNQAHLTVGFTSEYQRLAMGEGWVLVYYQPTNSFEVQKFDARSRFASDEAAWRWLRTHLENKPWRALAWALSRT